MKKKFNLKRNEEIASIVHTRVFTKTDSFFFYFKINEIGNIRICYSVNKKLGNAVVRNKIKRQVREMANIIVDKSLNYDIVIVVRKEYLQNDFQTNLSLFKTNYERIVEKQNEIKQEI